jgi:fatty-acyl-CoA synthase
METIKELLLWTESGYGRKEAIVDLDHDVRWTYADLNAAARSMCAGYAAAGITRGDRIGWLLMGPGADVTALSFGARKMGVIPVVMNARASAERIAWMIENIGIKALAYSSETAELLTRVRAVGIPTVQQFITLDDPLEPDHMTLASIYAEYADAEEPAVDISPDDVALVAYTSGSTGLPKPVMFSERKWIQACINNIYCWSVYYEDRFVNFIPPHFAGWAGIVSYMITAGASQLCLRFDPAPVARAIVEESCTHLILTPSMARMLQGEFERDPAYFSNNHIRICLLGGEAVTQDVLDTVAAMFPKSQLVAGLGATEATPVHSGVGNPRMAHYDGRLLGKPLPGITIELRDPITGEVIEGPGRPGELYVRGPIAIGVWGDAEATARNFPDGWWRSGDMLVRDEEDYLFFAGRADNIFKSGGIKVSAEDVEAVLKRHPLVLDAIVVSVPDERFGSVGHAFIRHRGELGGEDLAVWWRERSDADPYARPRHWTMLGVEPFPMVTTAKVDRYGLRERARQQHEAEKSTSVEKGE